MSRRCIGVLGISSRNSPHLAQHVLFRYLAATTEYFNSSPFLKPENLPPNETIAGLTGGLVAAHKAYGSSSCVHPSLIKECTKPGVRAWILFVVQPGERNVFDQRWLEYELIEKLAPTFAHIPRSHLLLQTFDTCHPPDL